MFEKASRQKLRFDSVKGQLTAEDLWDLPLTSSTGRASLDDVARALHRQLKNGDDVSFVNKEQKSDTTVQLKFDIVKHVIDVRLAENEAASLARANKEKKQQLLGIIALKETEQLMGTQLDELRKLADSM